MFARRKPSAPSVERSKPTERKWSKCVSCDFTTRIAEDGMCARCFFAHTKKRLASNYDSVRLWMYATGWLHRSELPAEWDDGDIATYKRAYDHMRGKA